MALIFQPSFYFLDSRSAPPVEPDADQIGFFLDPWDVVKAAARLVHVVRGSAAPAEAPVRLELGLEREAADREEAVQRAWEKALQSQKMNARLILTLKTKIVPDHAMLYSHKSTYKSFVVVKFQNSLNLPNELFFLRL